MKEQQVGLQIYGYRRGTNIIATDHATKTGHYWGATIPPGIKTCGNYAPRNGGGHYYLSYSVVNHLTGIQLESREDVRSFIKHNLGNPAISNYQLYAIYDERRAERLAHVW